jgi:exodeoxyribonuclease-3
MSWTIATFNVNGIRARLQVVLDWIEKRRPDVLCLQETKCRDEDFPSGPFLEAGYVVSVRGQKAFNGVALMSKSPPAELLSGLPGVEAAEEARFIAALVDGVWVVNTYVPQGRDPSNPAFQYKLNFLAGLKRWIEDRFSADTPLLWVGDLNVAPEEMDVFDPKRLDGQVGFHPAEREALKNVLSWGLHDLFRRRHPEEKQFTFWDYRLPKSYSRNLGWRLDHIMATAPAADASLQCAVDHELRGQAGPSDHAPIWAELDLDRLRQPH